MRNSALLEKINFQGIFNTVGEIFISSRGGGGHWAIILLGLDTFMIFPDFL